MKVLALSPHTDDIELGCGGYLAKLAGQGHQITALVFSDCSNIWSFPLLEECKASLKTMGINPIILEIPLRDFNKFRTDILGFLTEMKTGTPWDLVLTPSSSDIHQDHQVIHEESIRAFRRDCNLLAYELPWNTRSFNPNCYVGLNKEHIQAKINMLREYKSQIKLNREYFNEEMIWGQARGRGLQIRREYAEAFEVINWIE